MASKAAKARKARRAYNKAVAGFKLAAKGLDQVLAALVMLRRRPS